MEPLRPVVMMVVEILVVPAPSDRNVVVVPAFVLQIAQEDNVVTMDAEETPVDLVLLPKPVIMVSAPELLPLIVPQDSAVITEPVETVVTAQLDKDAEPESVNVTMIVMTETVEMPPKLMEPTLDCAHKDLVEPAQVDSPAEPLVDVQLQLLVMFQSLLSIVRLVAPSQQPVQYSLPLFP